MNITSEVIQQATEEYLAQGSLIQYQEPRTLKLLRRCVWCPNHNKSRKRKSKLCPTCAQAYNGKISTASMLELQATNYGLYEALKRDLFTDGIRHGCRPIAPTLDKFAAPA